MGHGESGPGVVHGDGTVSITRPPETMRVVITIQGKGATLKDAMAALKKHVDKAREEVVDLGASKDSIQLDAPRIAAANNADQQRRMQRMMAQRMAGGGRKNKKAKAAPPVTVNAKFTAEWPLKPKDGDELLSLVHPLQEKIREAKLAGLDAGDAESAEEEEANEEAMMQMQMNFNGQNEPKPGEPVFVFVSKVSDTDQKEALTEAFRKATQEATRLAQAAGAELGQLRSLNGNNSASADAEAFDGSDMYAYQAMQSIRMLQRRGGKKDEAEAIGTEPVPLTYNVSVMASFEIKPKK